MASRGIGEILTGAAVLLVAAGFIGFAVAHSGRTVATGYKLHASFDHVDGLAAGAEVRIAGVKVGNVLDMHVDPKSFLADVTFSVSDKIHLPKDSAAEIDSESLLGGKYLNLSPGGDANDIAAGGTITITQSSISLEQLLGKFIFSAASLTSKSSGASASGSDPKAATPKATDQEAPK
jgi:phospholipid/cholesterol/gamma-HCH transport system substrate-binding protein